MKIFECDLDHILVNRETGGAGSKVYTPDTTDDYLWVEVSREEYNKWRDKDNQKQIEESIKEQLKQAATVEIATLSNEGDTQIQYQDIDPNKVDITLPDTVYTFADLMSTVPTTLFNNADLNKDNIERIYNEVKHELNIQ